MGEAAASGGRRTRVVTHTTARAAPHTTVVSSNFSNMNMMQVCDCGRMVFRSSMPNYVYGRPQCGMFVCHSELYIVIGRDVNLVVTSVYSQT